MSETRDPAAAERVTGSSARSRWERALRADREIPWHVQSFLHFLASYMKPDGTGLEARVQEMMADSGLSKATVLRLVAEAESLGWLASRKVGRRTFRFPATPANRSHERDLSDEPVTVESGEEQVSPVGRVESSIGLTHANQSTLPDRSHGRDLLSDSHNALETPTQAAGFDRGTLPRTPATNDAADAPPLTGPSASAPPDAPPSDSSSGGESRPRARRKPRGRPPGAGQAGLLLPFDGTKPPPRVQPGRGRQKRRRSA